MNTNNSNNKTTQDKTSKNKTKVRMMIISLERLSP
jgi:hypothetical protein